MEFRILGPVEVVCDGRAVPVGGSRERAVLALLLASANRVVSAERLAEDLWNGEPPDGAAHSLQVFVSRLRKALREAGADGIIVTQPPGYVALLQPDSLDAARFEALVATARDRAAGGAPDEAAALLREALALWRGPALGDVADAPMARSEAARLEEARLAATEVRIDAELACGRHAELTAELDALTRAHPLRERLWGQRMLALYRCGRQVDALRAYRDLRTLLADEVGLDPSPTLAALEAAILQQAPELEWTRPGPPGPSPAPAAAEPAGGTAPPPASDLESLAGGAVTILFTDVEASTDLRTRHGDVIAQQLLRGHEGIVRSQVQAHGGLEVKALGDGFMVAFGSARRALSCAIAIQRTLADHCLDLPDVKVRIGVNTGEVVQEGDDLYGQAVHAAARIAAKADGGEILVSEIVRQLVGTTPEVRFVDRGRFRLKGFPDRFRLFEVPWGDGEAAPVATFAARTPYVGREAERAELGRLLEAAARSQGTLAVIGGEPGVGKTRLTEVAGTDAGRLGFRVLVGRCYEIDGAPPYVPFVEILDQALGSAPNPQTFRALLGDDAPEVAKLLPRLRRLFPDIRPPLELPPDQERHFLFNSLREFFTRFAAGRPLFLVLDDLHWADEGTLLLVEHLAERLPRLAVLAVGTYRDTEVTPDHRLARPLEDLLRQRLAERISLRRLPVDGVAALLGALGGQEPPTSLVAAVHGGTQGNPFFTEEVFKHLAEEGRLFDEDGRFRPEVTIDELEVPESLRLVLGRRIDRLGENGRRTLAAAAVVGRAFTYELLEALGELPPDALLDALDEAERARLIAPVSNAPDEDRLLFSHELIRQTLLADLSQPRRRRLHLQVADTLERLYAGSLDEQASEIAHHLAKAGTAADRRRLLHYLSLAGRQAMRTASGEDALRHFGQAIAMAHVADTHERPQLFIDRAFALRSLGRMDEALPDWDRAREGYEALHDPDEAARMAYEASFDLLWINRDEDALAMAEGALAALGDRETPLRARVLAGTGLVGAYVRPYEHGAEKIDEAVELAERFGDKRLLGYCLSNRAQHRFPFALFGEVLESGQEAIRLLRGEGDLWEVTTLLAFMEVAALEQGRLPLAAEFGNEVERLGTQLGHLFALGFIHGPAATVREMAVNPDLAALETSVSAWYELVEPMGFGDLAGAFRAHAAFLRGDWDEALRRAEDAVAHSLPRQHHTRGIDWGSYLLVLAYLGRAADVVAILDEDRFELPRPGRPNGFGWWEGAAGAIEALSVIGEADRAARLYPLLRELIDTTGDVMALVAPSRLYQRVAGIGAASGRQWDIAEEHYRTALRQAEEAPAVIEGAETRRWYARMLLERDARGDRDRARALLQEAIPVFGRVGMPRHEELARAVLPA